MIHLGDSVHTSLPDMAERLGYLLPECGPLWLSVRGTVYAASQERPSGPVLARVTGSEAPAYLLAVLNGELV
jgi:hypothetical protein